MKSLAFRVVDHSLSIQSSFDPIPGNAPGEKINLCYGKPWLEARLLVHLGILAVLWCHELLEIANNQSWWCWSGTDFLFSVCARTSCCIVLASRQFSQGYVHVDSACLEHFGKLSGRRSGMFGLLRYSLRCSSHSERWLRKSVRFKVLSLRSCEVLVSARAAQASGSSSYCRINVGNLNTGTVSSRIKCQAYPVQNPLRHQQYHPYFVGGSLFAGTKISYSLTTRVSSSQFHSISLVDKPESQELSRHPCMYVAGAAWHALILGPNGQLEVGCTLGNPTLRLPKYDFNLIPGNPKIILTPSLVAGNALCGSSQSLFFVWFLDFQGEVLSVKLGARAPKMNLHDYPIITPWDRNTPLYSTMARRNTCVVWRQVPVPPSPAPPPRWLPCPWR